MDDWIYMYGWIEYFDGWMGVWIAGWMKGWFDGWMDAAMAR